MKLSITLFFIFSIVLSSYCQYNGIIISGKSKPSMGSENIYHYSPPRHLMIPNKIYASIVYKKSGEDYFFETIPIYKIKGSYQFKFTAPDSVQVLILNVTDEKRRILDNNNEIGYILYLYKYNRKISASVYIDAADLLSYYARITLKLNKDNLTPRIVKLIQKAYKLRPAIKNQSTYYNYYLSLLYQQNKRLNKPKLLKYAKQMADARNNEIKWLNAQYMYRILGMEKEYIEIENKAIVNFPEGKIAQNKYLNNLFIGVDGTEQSILIKKTEYTKKFNDTSEKMEYSFNYNILSLLIQKKEYSKLDQYETLIDEKLQLTNLYNFTALKLLHEYLESKETSLVIAKSLSCKSLIITGSKIEKLDANRDDGILRNAYNRYIDTYAQILDKSGQYDSAFYYQNILFKQSDQLDKEVLEHYSVYAEKVKGLNYAKEVLEQNLLKGVNSPLMLQQLQSIYKKLNLPEDEFARLEKKNKLISSQKSIESIKAKLGSTSAKNFIIKNIDGKTISLSSFKNKVVVLDFWSTWCTPCIASFPDMQKLVSKYKEDNGVVFLFIDTWERAKPQKMKEAAIKILKEKDYSFNVLLDLNNKVATDYKVERIPMKFIINGKGEIVFMGDSLNIEIEIENAKN